jgi:hypothetical protein
MRYEPGGGPSPEIRKMKFFPNGPPLCFCPKFFKIFSKILIVPPFDFSPKMSKIFNFFHQNSYFLSIFSLKTAIFERISRLWRSFFWLKRQELKKVFFKKRTQGGGVGLPFCLICKIFLIKVKSEHFCF